MVGRVFRDAPEQGPFDASDATSAEDDGRDAHAHDCGLRALVSGNAWQVAAGGAGHRGASASLRAVVGAPGGFAAATRWRVHNTASVKTVIGSTKPSITPLNGGSAACWA